MTGSDEVHAWLAAAGAQHDLVEWARPFGADFERMWTSCPRGDWLLALGARLAIDRRLLVAAAARCVGPALEYVPEEELRPAACVEWLKAWGRGEAVEPRLAELRDGLMQAHSGARDAAMAEALLAFVSALDAVHEPAAAAGAAAFAAQAAMIGAGTCAMLAALSFAHRMQADAVRGAISTREIAERWGARHSL